MNRIILLGWISGSLIAGQELWAQASKTNAPAAPRTAPPPIIFRAAAGAAPAVRLTGGSRGAGDAAVRLDVLAPDTTGLTTLEHPTLFWLQSKPSPAGFEFAILEENSPKPLLLVKTSKASRSGIQAIRLADHGVSLETGVEYRWVVALVTDSENRSTDLVASGFIKRIEPSAELRDKLAHAPAEAQPAIYAAAGIWHDALASLSGLIEANPGNPDLRKLRADLLRQAGLAHAAELDLAP